MKRYTAWETKKSLIRNDKECYVCRSTLNIHKHHIYGGANRKISDKQGCWVYLCAAHHNMSDQGVHFNKALDTELKEKCQRVWEERNGSRQQFIAVFGKSYL